MKKNIDENKVIEISNIKQEPDWMKEFRLKAYKKFKELNNPKFGPELKIDFDIINYYKKIDDKVHDKWENVPTEARETFCKIGLPDAEKKYLAGVGAQFKEYFNNLVKYDENKYTALNGAVWSGGTFIYIPPKTKLDRPLQSYFRINSKNMGQFERTIIIVDEDSELHYMEGCTAPTYTSDSLHAAVVEIYVKKNAKCRYTTIQNWSSDVYNLVTKRAIVEESGTMEWIDGNIGSKINMKYPSCILNGKYASGNCISIAVATKDQIQDTGAKMIHLAPYTKSNIISKSIALNGGEADYRGTVNITSKAEHSHALVKCDTIILDEKSKSDTIPQNKVSNTTSSIEHEATVSKIDKEKLFYLMSRGIGEEKAKELLIMGFIERFREELPMEYAVELNSLLKNYF